MMFRDPNELYIGQHWWRPETGDIVLKNGNTISREEWCDFCCLYRHSIWNESVNERIRTYEKEFSKRMKE